MPNGDVTLLSQNMVEALLGVVADPLSVTYNAFLDGAKVADDLVVPDPFTITLTGLTGGSHDVTVEQLAADTSLLVSGSLTFNFIGVPPDGIRPTAQMVADLVRTRLIEEAGHTT